MITAPEQLPRSGQQEAQGPPVREPSQVFLMINSFETGGSERQFVAIAKSLDAQQFSVNVGSLQSKGQLRDSFGDVPCFRLGGSLYGWKSWRVRRLLSQHLRQNQIQIAHSFDFYTNLALVPAARWAGVPVVIGSQRQLGDLLSPAQARAQLMVFRWCDVVVCNSQAAAEKLVKAGFSRSKVRVIGNALSPEVFADVAPLLPRPPGGLRVGMIARMNAHYKNHMGFLRAAAKLNLLFPNIQFLFAGDGPLRPELEAEANLLGLAGSVQFLGDRRDIPAILASLDLVVVPSDSESLSNVILEAMAAGVPVVATRVGGNSELVNEERGILVPAQDIDAIVKAVEQLLNTPTLRAELGRNGRQFAKDNFSVHSIIGQYQDLYTEILSQKSGGSTRIERRNSAGSRLRVAIVAPSLRYVGGQAVQADLLMRHWKGDPDVEASFIPVDPQFAPGLRWLGRVPGLRTLIRTPIYLVGLWRGLRDVDITHIFSASYSSFMVAPLPAWILARISRGARNKGIVINYRSGEARDHLKGSPIARAVLKRTDRLVAPSGYLVDVFREFGLKAEVVPNMVDFSQFSYRKRLHLRPHLVCTRGFHPYYCIDVVVQAFAQVQRAYPEARLDLVGGGGLESQIRQLVSDLRLSNVNFCGVASRKEIGKYYDQADIFVNASHLDNMPVSVLEAFASGTPVISTSPAGMRYLVEHGRTGLLSEPGDAKALAENVLRVLRDPELALHLSLNAFEETRRYSWDSVREQWLDIYRSLARESLAKSGAGVI